MIVGYLSVAEANYIMVYLKDESALARYWQEMAGYTVKVGTIVSVVLSVILIFMFMGLTGQIRRLNRAAETIAGGGYQNRVPVKSRDEIGEFSHLFNNMTAAIEMHMEQLSCAAEEKQRFIDNLSHEMRTPVAAVTGYGELLKNADLEPEERLMAIDYIISQSQRLQNLSAKLLQLSSMKEDAIEMKPVALGEPVGRAIETLSGLMREKDIVCETDLRTERSIDDDDLCSERIIGDVDLLESLFQNLIENALRAMASGGGGRINIRSQRHEDRVTVTVEDNGPGMSATETAKIFEPFYRVDKARTSAHGGVGLGLSICRHICDIHRAGIAIQSEPGVGSRIVIDFYTITFYNHFTTV